MQWLLFDQFDGDFHVDAVPWLASWDVSAELSWPTSWARAMAVRLEVAVPRAPDDPFTVLWVHPRLVVAGHFGGEPAG